MTSRLTTATTAAMAAVVAVLAAPAAIASADESAQDTIADLRRQGYTVTLDKMGTGPLSKCIVTSVRNPQTMTQWVPYVGPGLGSRDGTFLVPVVTSQSITVSLDCTQH
ncbi:MAG TPA: hypothetical protein PKK01_06710 [Mycobacterium sp.]|nr:hypothetical protein [Mycobacterium sp.]